MNRRRLIKYGFGAVVAAVFGRVALLKSRDKPMPRIDNPELVMVKRWVLDATDMKSGPRN